MILLASQSPRRKEILEMAQIPFRILAADIDETPPQGIPPADIPMRLAQEKAEKVLPHKQQGEIILAADTLVYLGDDILGKPLNKAEGVAMLKALSGNRHEVITGVCILSDSFTSVFSCKTIVHFHKLTDSEINYYVENFMPMDKAGAYACQEWIGAIGIRQFEGDYWNVVGLPIQAVYQELKKHHFSPKQ
jgi:septum formation protein